MRLRPFLYICPMAVSALKVLRDAVKQHSFDTSYYIFGDDNYQKEDAVRQLLAAALDPGTRDFNLDVRHGPVLDARTLDSILQTPPMMAERRVVVIHDVTGLRKDVRKSLDRYLEAPAPDTLLLLVAGLDGKDDKTLARVATPLEFGVLSADRVPKWIAHHVSTELDTSITPQAAELLQNAVGNDLHQLVAELDKLASFAHGREIGEEDVSAVVGVRRGEMMPDLLDAIADRNSCRALEIVAHVLAQPKTSGVQLVMALATQFVITGWAKARRDEGTSFGRLQGEIFDLMKKSGSVFTGRTWGSAAFTWVRTVDSWDARSIDLALDALLVADAALKETRISSEEQVIANLILTICAGEQRLAA